MNNIKIFPFLLLFLVACNSKVTTTNESDKQDTVSISHPDPVTPQVDTVRDDKVYSNDRFREVTVARIGAHDFLIKGKAQIFEANFGWVLEDGHDELQTGHHMTDAGAPEWGNFSFTVNAPKNDPNTTLHLILFESSPKDGSRQFELPILLY